MLRWTQAAGTGGSRSCSESALGKDRILEIYLNIIEWGLDLRGFVPAARRWLRSRTARVDAGRDGLPRLRSSRGRSNTRVHSRTASPVAWAAFAD